MANSRGVSGTSPANEEYIWTDEDTEVLIRWRGEHDSSFTGRRHAAKKGFAEFVKCHGLTGKIDPGKIKRKWENLKQKYKTLKDPKTGVSTEGGETTAASWRWFTLMDEALGQRPSISPPVLVDSSGQDVVVVSPASASASTSTPAPTPAKKRKAGGGDWVAVFQGMQEAMEERENVHTEREERREREALEREERMERERTEREEKRERELMEREERREREWREREDRREKAEQEREERYYRQMRELEERRERESRAREDKLLDVLRVVLGNQN